MQLFFMRTTKTLIRWTDKGELEQRNRHGSCKTAYSKTNEMGIKQSVRVRRCLIWVYAGRIFHKFVFCFGERDSLLLYIELVKTEKSLLIL